jgi:hypothetical protein
MTLSGFWHPLPAPARLLLKALLLFVAANLFFAWLRPPVENLLLFRRAPRFPSIWEPALGAEDESGTGFRRVMISDLGLLFHAHEISSQPKAGDEYRVILLGDSAGWGAYLLPEQTASALINRMDLRTCAGKKVKVYNLSYPFLSATKDLMILSEAMKYEPDMIIWSFSLIGFTAERQTIDFVAENPARLKYLKETYGLKPEIRLAPHIDSFGDHTLIGRRRELNLALRLNFSEVMLRALGTDEPRAVDDNVRACRSRVGDNLDFRGFLPPADLETYANLDGLKIAARLAGNARLIYVNEPTCIQPDGRTGVRYNFHYPHWAYDQYRLTLGEMARENDWTYVDLWDYLLPSEFSNSIFHRTPEGEQRLAQKFAEIILAQSCVQP